MYARNSKHEEDVFSGDVESVLKCETISDISNSDGDNEAYDNRSGSEAQSDTEEELLTQRPTKKKRENLVWIFEEKFANVSEAQDYLDAEDTWSKHYSRESAEGKKIFYRCNKVKTRGPQCPCRMYLLFDSTSDEVFMYKTDTGHDHQNKRPSMHGIHESVKEEINRLVALHMPPRAIMGVLEKTKGIKLPTHNQLRNYLCERRRTQNANYTISLAELKKWLQQNSTLPKNSHETFVVAYEVSVKDRGNASFRFILSTKYLLELASAVDVVHADTTCTFIWQGYPVMTIGTTDKGHKFHPLCLFASTTEEKEDYRMLFKSLKVKTLELFSSPFKPDLLVVDSAESIQKAFSEEFEGAAVRICWAHARKKIKSQIDSLVNKSNQEQILEDIDTLQSITNKEAFEEACELFLQKYVSQVNFITYFKQQWLKKNVNWHLGALPMRPYNNIALEAFNKGIKNTNTFRERLQLSRFLMLAKQLVSEWSDKYVKDPEHSLATAPLISTKDWTNALDWSRRDNEINVKPSNMDNYTIYEVRDDESKGCNVQENKPMNFDDYAKFLMKWDVKLPGNAENWAQGSCTCPNFFRTYKCHHVIGLAIIYKKVVPPLLIKDLKIGEKRKRGRPRKSQPVIITP